MRGATSASEKQVIRIDGYAVQLWGINPYTRVMERGDERDDDRSKYHLPKIVNSEACQNKAN
jgi:hypothetical protein